MSEPSSESKKRSVLGMLLITLLKLTWTFLVICTPALGFWLASSLATYLNGPVWLSGLGGALLFPILPLLWEWRGWVKYKRREDPGPRVLTFMDRMTLRTLTINLAFLGALLATFPQASFLALSTRGDWMLEGVEGQGADQVRSGLFATAEGLEFLYLMTVDNPYEKFDDGSSTKIVPKPNHDDTRRRIRQPSEVDDQDKTRVTVEVEPSEDPPDPKNPNPNPPAPTTPDPRAPEKPEPPRRTGEAPAWPMKAEMHPIVSKIPLNHQGSPASVARYIASQEPDPFQRVKAMHDYVIDRLSYDHERLRRMDLTAASQKPDVVFRTKLAVCAGYAKLLVEMGKHSGDEIVYITGDTRDDDGNQNDVGHAWNAVKIEGSWFLMDATWDDPSNPDRPSEQSYRTTYLFTPVHIFGVDHFPSDPVWQLRREPLTRGEFLRQPLVDPAFYVAGLEFIDPKRSQVSASSRSFVLKVGNTLENRIVTRLSPKGVERNEHTPRCRVRGKKVVEISCTATRSGTYHVELFAGPKHLTMYPYAGRFEVHVP